MEMIVDVCLGWGGGAGGGGGGGGGEGGGGGGEAKPETPCIRVPADTTMIRHSCSSTRARLTVLWWAVWGTC